MTDHRAKVREIVEDFTRGIAHASSERAVKRCQRIATDRILAVIGGWRPIEEAPRDGVIDGWVPGLGRVTATRRFLPDATHWRPLPAPPEASDG